MHFHPLRIQPLSLDRDALAAAETLEAVAEATVGLVGEGDRQKGAVPVLELEPSLTLVDASDSAVDSLDAAVA